MATTYRTSEVEFITKMLRDKKYETLSNTTINKYWNEKKYDLIVNGCVRFAFAEAKKYDRGNHGNLGDLFSVACLGLCDALKDFSPSKGNFLTYARWYIKKNLSLFVTDDVPLIYKPFIKSIGSKATKVKDEFYAKNGYDMPINDLVDFINENCNVNINNDDLNDNISSFNDVIDDDDISEDSKNIAYQSATYNEYENTIEEEDTHEKCQELMSVLNERETIIINDYYFNNISVNDIAEKVNLSPIRINQILKESLKKMKKYSDSISA